MSGLKEKAKKVSALHDFDDYWSIGKSKRIIYEITITDESVLDLIRHDDRVLKIRRISGK
jgi:hypothetical protein